MKYPPHSFSLKKKYITVDQKQVARHQFFSARQAPGETFIDFKLRLNLILERCQFTNFHQDRQDEMLLEMLLANTTNTKIQSHAYTHQLDL